MAAAIPGLVTALVLGIAGMLVGAFLLEHVAEQARRSGSINLDD